MWLGIMIPFIGTVLGAACVFFMKGDMKPSVQKILSGFAAGVMVAASVWSLLIPSMEMVEDMGRLSFLPASVGFILGIAFLLLLDRIIPHLHVNEAQPEGIKAQLKKSSMLVLAVTLHNIPEGMAVGAVFAGMIADNGTITMMGALAAYISSAPTENFQPMGANMGILPDLPERIRGKQEKYQAYADRGMAALEQYLQNAEQ